MDSQDRLALIKVTAARKEREKSSLPPPTPRTKTKSRKVHQLSGSPFSVRFEVDFTALDRLPGLWARASHNMAEIVRGHFLRARKRASRTGVFGRMAKAQRWADIAVDANEVVRVFSMWTERGHTRDIVFGMEIPEDDNRPAGAVRYHELGFAGTRKEHSRTLPSGRTIMVKSHSVFRTGERIFRSEFYRTRIRALRSIRTAYDKYLKELR